MLINVVPSAIGSTTIRSAQWEGTGQVFSNFILFMALFSYCEFNLTLFFYSPLTFATIYYISITQEADMIEVYNQVSPNLKFRVTNPTQ